MRTAFVAGNWKMHGSIGANLSLLDAIVAAQPSFANARCAVCVPYPYLAQAQARLTGTPIQWGAQNVSEHGQGAYTGEVSGAMLAEFGARLAIVGHSERRSLYGEDDARVANKFLAAQQARLTPILCVGETLTEREAGVTEQIVARQLDAVLDQAGVTALGAALIAYEPVWAIGTGKTAAPEDANSVHQFIRARIAARDRDIAQRVTILYGGSVKAANAAQLFGMSDIDGGLIGGASLIAAEFIAICQAAAARGSARAAPNES